jgi:glycosyltransferase involved in cell wall biosynthesis
MKKCINLVCDTAPNTSFGMLAKWFTHGLVERGWHVRVVPFTVAPVEDPLLKSLIGPTNTKWPRFVVHYMSKDMGLNIHAGDILYTLWETSVAPALCVDVINRARHVFVSCYENKAVFQRSGVKRPVSVIPLGVDTKVFSPSPEFPKGKIFATAGRNIHGRDRKGIDRVIAGFVLAFPTETDVVLRVKDHPNCLPYAFKDPRVQFITRFLRIEDMVQFYQECLCFVSGASGEGWGLHQHEAMMCGKPLVSVRWMGLEMFFKGTVHGYELPYKMQSAVDYFFNSGAFAVPSVEDIAVAFRAVYTNPRDYFLRGLQAYVDVKKFSLVAMNDKLEHELEKLI